MLESILLEHVPPNCTIHVAVFDEVRNAAFLRSQLLAGNHDFEYALADASVVYSRTHVLAAAYRAINAYLSDSLKSRNVHSEIILSLSPSNNIAEAFRRFGIADDSKALVIVKVAPEGAATAQAVQDHLSAVVEGRQVAFTDGTLRGLCDEARIRKLYKLNAPAGAGRKKQAVQESVPDVQSSGSEEIGTAILAAMALRGAL